MGLVDIGGTRLWVEDTGGDGPPVLFSHGLLWSARMFEAQIAGLRDRYRCVAYDHRGQGRSDVPPESVIPIDLLTADALALIDRLGLGPLHLVGLSTGGFVAMRIAARRPDLVRSLVLLETSAGPEPPRNVPRYRVLGTIFRLGGVRLVEKAVMDVMFGETFRTDPGRTADRQRWVEELRRNDRSITKALNGVLQRPPVLDELPAITAPTLVVVGTEDVATVPAKSERIAAGIPGAELARIPGAGHTSTVEQPDAVTRLIGEFLDHHRG